MYLVVADAYSKWPEVVNFRNNNKTYKVIEVINELFARYGLANLVIADNGLQLRGDELKAFYTTLTSKSQL